MPFYIQNPITMTTCIGDSLATFNINFSALDTNLYNLSTYSHTSIDYLSSTVVSVSSQLASEVNYLSSSLVSVSGILNNEIYTASSYTYNQLLNLSSYTYAYDAYLDTNMRYVSSHLINDYVAQGTLYCPSDGQSLNWDTSIIGHNARVVLSANIHLANPTNMRTGQGGNLILAISTAGKAVTSYGNLWTFSSHISSTYATMSATNLISYYYDGSKILSTMTKYLSS